MTNGLAYLSANLPIRPAPYRLGPDGCGLVVVDEVNGFATLKGGNLAPQAPNAQVEQMIDETDRLARSFAAAGRPIAVFLDSHQPGKPEPPYPAHCERGTGEDELVPALKWLETCPQAILIRKDCINGFVGAEAGEGRGNRIVSWVNDTGLASIIVVGICTDICVMDFVLTMLSARNHGMMPPLTDIVVYEPGCATYALPIETAMALGLPATAAHPQAETHHLDLYFMASRGAILASSLV